MTNRANDTASVLSVDTAAAVANTGRLASIVQQRTDWWACSAAFSVMAFMPCFYARYKYFYNSFFGKLKFRP